MKARNYSHDSSLEYVEKEFSTIVGVGNGHWPKTARDSIEISRHCKPLTSSFGQNIVLVVSYLRYD